MKHTAHRTAALLGVLVFTFAASTQAQTARSTFTNSSVNIIDRLGPATTYPSTIAVAGLSAVWTYHLSVSINLSHTLPSNLDILLVSPSGPAVMLLSDVGHTFDWANNTRIDIDDCAPRSMGDAFLTAGRFRPSNVRRGSDAMPMPAPVGPYNNTLSDFNYATPDGTWSLYVVDDNGSAIGQINSWSLTFYTQPRGGLRTSGRNPISCTAPDYDGDGRTDVALYRQSTGEWFVAQSGSNDTVVTLPWGSASSAGLGDTQVPADYDGDGVTDLAVYRASSGEWLVWRSFELTVMQIAFGAPSSFGTDDQPIPGDYDGDGLADLAIFRRTTGEWFLRPSSGHGQGVRSFPFGFPPAGDRPAR